MFVLDVTGHFIGSICAIDADVAVSNVTPVLACLHPKARSAGAALHALDLVQPGV